MQVYKPREDSWLLEKSILREKLERKKCLDLGTGSGIQAEAMLKAGAKEIWAVDVNPEALKAAKAKDSRIKPVESDLFAKLGKEKFDLIAFNPPYVPSEGIKFIEADGGKDGREVIDGFLQEFSKHLAAGGIVLLLVSSLNKIPEIKKLLEKEGFECKAVESQKLFFEELQVLRIMRQL